MEVTYNGYDLGFIRTRSIEDVPVYEGPDYLYTTRTLSVSSILSRPQVSPNGLGPEFDLKVMQEALEQPRRDLVVTLGGRPFFHTATTPDVANGPFPRRVAVTRVDGTTTLLVDFVIEVNYTPECLGGAGRPNYLSHRWTESVQIDENFYTTWNRRGKIITRGDSLTDPDALRGVVCPPLTPGLVRESSEYTIQPDGLALEYSYRDRERYLLPPPPATKASGRYTETSQKGAVRYGEVRVSLEAPKTVAKADVLVVAVACALQRLIQAGPIQTPGQAGPFLAASMLAEDLWENRVEVCMRAMLTKHRERYLGLTHGLGQWGVPPVGSDPNTDGTLPADPGTRGTAGLALISAALNDPCLFVTSLKAGGTDVSLKSDTQDVPAASVSLKTIPPGDQLAGLKTYQDRGYSNYVIRSNDVIDTHTHMMPVTKHGAKPVFVALANTTRQRVVDWTAESTGKAPTAPDWNQRDPKWVFLKGEIHREDPDMDSDGVTKTWKLTGRYVYGWNEDGQKDVDLSAAGGIPPWMDAPGEDSNTIDFVQGIIDFDQQAGGGQGPPPI